MRISDWSSDVCSSDLLIETWTAASTTASSITGDVRFSGDKITFQNGKSLPLQKVGSVTVGDFDGKAVPAMLYKVTKPATLALLRENTLCGRNPVTYIAVRPFAGLEPSPNASYGSKQPSGVHSSGLHCPYQKLGPSRWGTLMARLSRLCCTRLPSRQI